MTGSGASIEFDDRYEVGELIHMVERYVDMYTDQKENQTVMEFYKALDRIELEW